MQKLLPMLLQLLITKKQEADVSLYFEKKYPWLKKDHVGNLYYYNENTPLVCAHMDNVWSAQAHENLHNIRYDSQTTIIKWSHNIWADDKCWLAFIDYLLETKYLRQAPTDLSILLCVEEETWMLWSRTASKNHDLLNTCNFCLILDRRNAHDIIRYCEDDFLTCISEYTEKYWFKEADWLCCDLDSFCEQVPWVNLSCWYYNPHMDTEYIRFSEFENAVNMALEILNDKEICNTKFKPYDNLFKFWSSRKWYSRSYNHSAYWWGADDDSIILEPNDTFELSKPCVVTNLLTWEQFIMDEWSYVVEDARYFDREDETNEDNPYNQDGFTTRPYAIY